MRNRLLGAGSAVLLVFVLSATATAQTNDDVAPVALTTVKTNVGDAIRLEKSALRLAKDGNQAGAKEEIKNAEDLLEGAYPAADALTPSPGLSTHAPGSGWEHLDFDIRLAARDDAKAVRRRGAPLNTGEVEAALFQKNRIYDLVNGELTHPLCSVLINLQGPIEVNGVPQGHAQLSVDVSCTTPIKRVLVDTPDNAVTTKATDGGAKSATDYAAYLIDLFFGGGKSGGVTETTSPDAADGQPVDIEIVPIVGDSVEYYPETM